MALNAYTPVAYKDAPNTTTPLTAANLNKTDAQVKAVTDAVRAVETSITSGAINGAITGVAAADERLQVVEGVQAAHDTAIKANATATAGLQTSKADKSAISNVNNTADSAKPVSTAQKAALDKKADIVGIHKTINETLPTQHTEEVVDLNTLGYGEHTVHTDTALNAPEGTRVTVVQVLRTHSTEPSTLPYTTLPDNHWEQGSISDSYHPGKTYDELRVVNAEYDKIRLRSKELIPLNEYSRVRLTATEYGQYIVCFDADKKTTGKVHPWTAGEIIISPGTKYIAVLIRKNGNPEITPAVDVPKFKVATSPADALRGEGKLFIAWGATKGDLHTRIAVGDSFGAWSKIGSVLPVGDTIEEGSTLEYRGGHWVAVPPAEAVRTPDGV